MIRNLGNHCGWFRIPSKAPLVLNHLTGEIRMPTILLWLPANLSFPSRAHRDVDRLSRAELRGRLTKACPRSWSASGCRSPRRSAQPKSGCRPGNQRFDSAPRACCLACLHGLHGLVGCLLACLFAWFVWLVGLLVCVWLYCFLVHLPSVACLFAQFVPFVCTACLFCLLAHMVSYCIVLSQTLASNKFCSRLVIREGVKWGQDCDETAGAVRPKCFLYLLFF